MYVHRQLRLWTRLFTPSCRFLTSVNAQTRMQSPRKGSRGAIGVFWDFDNIRPGTWEERSVTSYTDPVKQLAHSLGLDAKLHAFGADVAWTYVSQQEQVRREDIGPDVYDAESHTSGYDEEIEMLRCGVCGQRFSSEEKLAKHFKSLHLREQRKLKEKRKKKGNLKDKENTRLKKYGAAAPGAGITRSGYHGKGLRRLVKEAGVSVTTTKAHSQATDQALASAALEFLSQQHAKAVVVMSRDTDFLPLLQEAKDSNILTVLALDLPAPNSTSSLPLGIPVKLFPLVDLVLAVGDAHDDVEDDAHSQPTVHALSDVGLAAVTDTTAVSTVRVRRHVDLSESEQDCAR